MDESRAGSFSISSEEVGVLYLEFVDFDFHPALQPPGFHPLCLWQQGYVSRLLCVVMAI